MLKHTLQLFCLNNNYYLKYHVIYIFPNVTNFVLKKLILLLKKDNIIGKQLYNKIQYYVLCIKSIYEQSVYLCNIYNLFHHIIVIPFFCDSPF